MENVGKIVGKQKRQLTDIQLVVLDKSDRERIRTFDRLLRRQMLYPAELRDQKKKEIHRLSADMQTNLLVGVAGFEPATSSSQTRRDDRATLHPEV